MDLSANYASFNNNNEISDNPANLSAMVNDKSSSNQSLNLTLRNTTQNHLSSTVIHTLQDPSLEEDLNNPSSEQYTLTTYLQNVSDTIRLYREETGEEADTDRERGRDRLSTFPANNLSSIVDMNNNNKDDIDELLELIEPKTNSRDSREFGQEGPQKPLRSVKTQGLVLEQGFAICKDAKQAVVWTGQKKGTVELAKVKMVEKEVRNPAFQGEETSEEAPVKISKQFKLSKKDRVLITEEDEEDDDWQVIAVEFNSSSELVCVLTNQVLLLYNAETMKKQLEVPLSKYKELGIDPSLLEVCFLNNQAERHKSIAFHECLFEHEDLLILRLDGGLFECFDCSGLCHHHNHSNEPGEIKSRLIQLRRWDEYYDSSNKYLEKTWFLSPTCLFVQFRNHATHSGHLAILKLHFKISKLFGEEDSQEPLLVDFEEEYVYHLLNTTSILETPQEQLGSYSFLVKKEKPHNQEVEINILATQEGVGKFVLNSLFSLKDKVITSAWGFQEYRYIILVEDDLNNANLETMFRIYMRKEGTYESVFAFNPFETSIGDARVRLELSSNQDYLNISLIDDYPRSSACCIPNPFPRLVTFSPCQSLDCHGEEEVEKLKATSPKPCSSGMRLHYLNKTFKDLPIIYKECMASAFQSFFEDQGILLLKEEGSLEPLYICLFKPSTLIYQIVIDLKEYDCRAELNNIIKIIKVQGSHTLLLVTAPEGKNPSGKVFQLQYDADVTSKPIVTCKLLKNSFESISQNGRYIIFINPANERQVIIKEIIDNTVYTLESEEDEKEYDICGDKLISWPKPDSSDTNVSFYYLPDPSSPNLTPKLLFSTSPQAYCNISPFILPSSKLCYILLKKDLLRVDLSESVKKPHSKLKLPSLPRSSLSLPPSLMRLLLECTWSQCAEGGGERVLACRVKGLGGRTDKVVVIEIEGERENGAQVKVIEDLSEDSSSPLCIVGREVQYLLSMEGSKRVQFRAVGSPEYSSHIDLQTTSFNDLPSIEGLISTQNGITFWRTEKLSRKGGFGSKPSSSSEILLQASIPFFNPSSYGLSLLKTEAALYLSPSTGPVKRALHCSNLVGLSLLYRASVLDNKSLYTAFVYHLNNESAMQRYMQTVQVPELITHDKMVTSFFFRPNVEAGKVFLKGLEEYMEGQGRMPFKEEGYLKQMIIENNENLLLNNLTRKLLKLLLFAPTNIYIDGELAKENRNIRQIPVESPKELSKKVHMENDVSTRASLASLSKNLLLTQPHQIQTFQTHQSKISLDLSNGSPFSLAFFGLISKLDNADIRDKYWMLIYFKWNHIFPFALGYAIFYLFLNTLAYAYLGQFWEDAIWGYAIILMNLLFIAFEVKCLVSDAEAYFEQFWNLIDILLHSSTAIACLLIIFDPDWINQYAVNWFRMGAMVLLSVRGVTMLRVFGPLRHFIRMLIQVFFDIPPFMIVFTAGLLIWTYMWALVPGLTLDPDAEELPFAQSFKTMVGMVMGNTPDSEADGNQLGGVKFAFLVLGNTVLVITMLNFLIAVISDTYGRVSEEKGLYDSIELLQFIRDFDSFLRGFDKVDKMGVLSRKKKDFRFVALCPRGQESDWEVLEEALSQRFDKLDEKVEKLAGKIGKIEQKNEGTLKLIEKKLSALLVMNDPTGQKRGELGKREQKEKKFSSRTTKSKID